MKKQFLLLFGLLLIEWVKAQSLVGSAGGWIPPTSGISIEYAVGEVAIETIQPNGTMPVLQGLLQPTKYDPFVIAETGDVFDAVYGFTCFPNPSFESFSVETTFLGFDEFLIFSADGRLAGQGKFDYQPVVVGHLPAGNYLVKLCSKQHLTSKTFQIIKL